MTTDHAHTWKDEFIGGAIMAGLLAVPVLGCALAIVYNSGWWLVLLLPLFAFMETGLFLIVVALMTVAYVNGW